MGEKKEKKVDKHVSSGAGYGLGVVGALIYFLSHATTFGAGALGVFKAMVWPAILVYLALGYFGA